MDNPNKPTNITGSSDTNIPDLSSEPATPALNGSDSSDSTGRYSKRGMEARHAVLGLERRNRAIQFFMGREGLPEGEYPTENQKRWQNVDEQFRRHLSAILAREDLYPDSDKAWERFEYWKAKASTIQQRDAMSMNKEEFIKLFEKTREYLFENEENIQEEVDRSLEKNIKAEEQYSTQTIRNFERIKEDGITIEIDKDFLEGLRQRSDDEYTQADKIDLLSNRPILEQIKTERGISIEGHSDSKISLSIHDCFDHLWLMGKLEKQGVLEKYSEFLRKIGNPLWRNIFGREGEVIASIGYSYRYSKTIDRGIKPYFSFDQIKKMLEKGIDRSKDPNWQSIDESQLENLESALKIVESIPDEVRRDDLAFSFSNYVVEYLEQIRKHGNIKIQDKEGVFIDKLSPINPEIVAFFVECFNLLSNTEFKSENTLIKLETILEQKIIDAIKGDGPSEFVISLQDLDSPDLDLENPKTRWFKNNLGFAATRNRIDK